MNFKNKFPALIALFLILGACVQPMPFDAKNKIREQDGRPVYSVPIQTSAGVLQAIRERKEQNSIAVYCPNGATELSRSEPKFFSVRQYQYVVGANMYSVPEQQSYTITVVCN